MTAGSWSPDVGNLLVGKGHLIFKVDGESAFYHLGNAPALSITPKVTTLDHFDSKAGTKTKDLSIVVEKTLEVKIDLEEFTAKNIALLMLGDVDDTDPDAQVVNIFSRASITGHLKFFAANDIGPRWHIDFPSITFNPSGDFSPITDSKFAVMSITGSVNAQNGVWGTATQKPAVSDVVPENVLIPFITGDAIVGEELTAHVGGWIGANTFAYNWKVAGTTPGGGATITSTYTPVVGDVGKQVTVEITGTNLIGSTGPVSSANYGPVAAY